MSPLAGLARVASRAVGGLALDVSSGVARAAEAARAAATGTSIGPASLRVSVVILSDERGLPMTTPEAMAPSIELATSVLTAEAGIRVRVTDMQVIASSEPAVRPVAVTSPWRKVTPSRFTGAPNSRLMPSRSPTSSPTP